TNIEYMGQQINQQRLALANASAGLFEKMLSMVPPTPPSSQDDKYFTQGYKFTDPADEIQKSIKWESTGAKIVQSDFTGHGVTGPIVIGPVGAGPNISLTLANLTAIAGGASLPIGAGTVNLHALASALGIAASSTEIALGYTEVIRNVDIEHTVYNPNGQLETKTVSAPALLVFDNLNRLLRFTLLNKNSIEANPAEQTTANTADWAYSMGAGDKLTYGGTFDDTAYANDMNKYEFQKASYDYQVERINQETRQIQSQDKSLELKMKQLDTEHNAVQTEMEAVQKVIQKNIEGSFKTFA
ncbi:MAG: hypothetical protein WCF95_02765, partial [bacterium]